MKKTLAVLGLASAIVALVGCESGPTQLPQSTSGVVKTQVKVDTGPDGLTTEQRNVGERLVDDNKPGAIKHLYVISAYSGQVIIYSTVRGKVTSSGKRLTPTTVAAYGTGNGGNIDGIDVVIGNQVYETNEVLQDDGTYGHSMDYLFWRDTRSVYHQHYVTGGQILHISDQPLAVKGIIINMEISQKPQE